MQRCRCVSPYVTRAHIISTEEREREGEVENFISQWTTLIHRTLQCFIWCELLYVLSSVFPSIECISVQILFRLIRIKTVINLSSWIAPCAFAVVSEGGKVRKKRDCSVRSFCDNTFNYNTYIVRIRNEVVTTCHHFQICMHWLALGCVRDHIGLILPRRLRMHIRCQSSTPSTSRIYHENLNYHLLRWISMIETFKCLELKRRKLIRLAIATLCYARMWTSTLLGVGSQDCRSSHTQTHRHSVDCCKNRNRSSVREMWVDVVVIVGAQFLLRLKCKSSSSVSAVQLLLRTLHYTESNTSFTIKQSQINSIEHCVCRMESRRINYASQFITKNFMQKNTIGICHFIFLFAFGPNNEDKKKNVKSFPKVLSITESSVLLAPLCCYSHFIGRGVGVAEEEGGWQRRKKLAEIMLKIICQAICKDQI